MVNSWLILILVGLFEAGFTICMKLSGGFIQIKYTICFLFFLNKAIAQIPLGTAYTV
jgi:quaternary ammonium compound-resistance protein SugE